MNTKETRIEFIGLEFTGLVTLKSGLDIFPKEARHLLILSMNWPWHAPDKNDFNCAYTFPLADVGNRNTLHRQKFITRSSDRLCISTVAQGKSTIRFTLICADITNNNSPIKKAFDKMGEIIIGKSSPGEISGITLMEGARTFANYNLERIVESVSDKENPDRILCRGHLDFDSKTTKTEKGKIISMKTDNDWELLKLCISVVRE